MPLIILVDFTITTIHGISKILKRSFIVRCKCEFLIILPKIDLDNYVPTYVITIY